MNLVNLRFVLAVEDFFFCIYGYFVHDKDALISAPSDKSKRDREGFFFVRFL